MFGKKLLTQIFAVLLLMSLLISTFIPQAVFAKGGPPGGGPPGGGPPGGDPPSCASGDFSIKGEKIWDDKHNQAQARPPSVTIILYKNGIKFDQQTTNANMNWKYEFNLKGQPYDADYRIGEADLSGNNYVISQIVHPTITTIETSEYSWGNKTTSNNKNKFSFSSGKLIAVKLTDANFEGKVLIWTPTEITDPGAKVDIEASIKKVPELKNGKGYVYIYGFGPNNVHQLGKHWIKVFKEGGKQYIEFSHTKNWSMFFLGDHTTKVERVVTDSSITNTYKSKINIPVCKVWDDGNNQDGLRPREVTIKLLADGEDTGKKLELKQANNWAGTFKNLDTVKNGKTISYTVKEAGVGQEYSTSITGSMKDGFTVTNSHTPETITVSGKKTWNDEDNQDGARPTSIVIRLRKNNRVIDSKEVTVDDGWTWSFPDLAKYSNGKRIKYTITEDRVRNYKTTVCGYNVTNSYKPGKTNVHVSKVWEDDENLNKLRPASVTIKLLADGEDTYKRLVLNEGNDWADSFSDLDEYSEGNKIVYTVEEETVPANYGASVTGDATEGFVVTNTLIKQTVGVTIQGLKSLSGRNLQDEEFTFELYQDTSEPVPVFNIMSLSSGQPDQTTTNIGGSWSFNLTFDRAGWYEYVIREQQGNLPGVTYDQTEYRVYVHVYFSNGELLADLYGADEGEITADDLVFRNSYRGQPPPTTSLPGIEVKKIVEEKSFSKAGDLLHYSIEVKNTGNLALVKLTVDDERLGISDLEIDLTANPLQPGETHTHTFAEPYLVIQADVDAAEAIINTVKVTGETAEGLKADDEGEATVPFEQTAPAVPISISLEKLVKEKSFTKAGDELHYSFTILNDGLAAVVKLTVNDPKLGIDDLVIDLSDHPLMPGDSYTYDFPAPYQVTEADIAAEKIVNKLTVVAESAEGASSEAEADVITPREQTLPLEPELPQTGEHIGYRTGIVSLILGGALVLIAINKRKRISFETDKAD